jgi:signal transduction histidine kinase
LTADIMNAQDHPDRLDTALQRIAALEEAVSARDQFIATIGHEMRNPMVPIVLSVDRLRRFAAASDWLTASLDMLDRATAAFMRRATQLLDVSRFAGGNFALELAPVDLSAIVRDTAIRHAEIARRAGCSLTTRIAPDVMARGDHAAIEQLLDNVLANAFKYGAARPVEVTLSRDAAEARVVVADRGNGIPAEAQARIFALFERTRETDAPGLGIGLWIAARLAAAMGGKIEVNSAPGEGAAFTICLKLEQEV